MSDRTHTPPKPNATGGTTIRVHRCCNGCGRDIGDANDSEILRLMAGQPLPDVRSECGCTDAPTVPEWTEVPVENLVTPIHRGRTIDCDEGGRFIFTGTSRGRDEIGEYIVIHGRDGKWSKQALARLGDVVRVQAKGA